MPYQRSTKAQGFKKRTAFDDSSQLRQYSKDLDAKRKEEVRDYERVATQHAQENIRIDAALTKKDTYELNNLKQFSKTLNEFMETAAKTLGKQYIDAQVDIGINDGVKAAQGDKEALAKIEFSEKQLKEIDEKVAEQKKISEGIIKDTEEKWDEAGYRASLEEKYKLLNIRKLGANRAYGFRKGLLTQSAVGWDAYRDSALLFDPDNEISTRNIGTDEDPIIIGRYRTYDDRDKKNAILTFLQREYIKQNSFGLNKILVERHLTRPMLERTATFQQKEYERELRDEFYEAGETLKENVSIALKGIDAESQLDSNGTLKPDGALYTAVQEWLWSGGNIYQGMGVQGSGNGASLDALVEHLVGKGSELRSGEHANVDDQEDLLTWLQTAKFDVPGITKDGKPDTLPNLWSDKFEIGHLRREMMYEAHDRENKRRAALKLKATVELENAVKAYHDTGDMAALNVTLNGIKGDDQYSGILDEATLNNYRSMATEMKIQSPIEADRTLQSLDRRYHGLIPHDAEELKRIPKNILKKWQEDGKIVEDPFKGNETLRDLTGTLSAEIVTKAKELLKNETDETFGEDHLQIQRLSTQLPSKLLATAYRILEDNSHLKGYTLHTALGAAKVELMAQLENDTDPQFKGESDGYFKMDRTGFVNESLNPKYSKQIIESSDKKRTRLERLFVRVENQIDQSGRSDYFSDRDAPPLVTNKIDYIIDEKSGEIASIWHTLTELDPLRRPGEVLYNLEAAKQGLPTIDWSKYPNVQAEIDKWDRLNVETKKKLTSHDRSVVNNGLNESGSISMDYVTNTIIPQNNEYFITEQELPGLLTAAGLPQMTYAEFQNDENLQRKLFKTKTYSLIKQIEQVTSNKDEGLRRLFAGIKYGDHNKYNDEGIADWTMKALNSYYSGDTSVLEKHDKSFSLTPKPKEVLKFDKENFTGSSSSIYGEELATDINGLNTQLSVLESNVPDRYIRIDSSKLGFFEGSPLGIKEPENWMGKVQQAFDPAALITRSVRSLAGREYQYVVNPEYTQYVKRRTAINDNLNIITARTKPGHVTALQLEASIKRVIGEERYNEVRKEWIGKRDKYKAGKLESVKGNVSYKRLMALLYEEPEIVSLVNANDLDQKGNLNTIPTDTFVGDFTTGRLKPSQLTTVKGFGGGYTVGGGEITIRNDVAPSLIEMLRAAREAGHSINVNSGYRNLKEQAKLYKKAVKNNERDKDGNLAAKKPGESNHNLGTAVDLNYTVEGYQWLLDNASKFGFFPYQEGLGPEEMEAWHWDFKGTN